MLKSFLWHDGCNHYLLVRNWDYFLQRKSFQGLGCCVFLKSNLFGKFITTLSGRKPQLRFEFSSDSSKYSSDIPLSQIIGRFCWKVWIRVRVWVQGLSFVVNFNFCWRNSVSTLLPHNDDLASLRCLMIMIIFQTNSRNTNTRITLPASSYLPSKKPTGAPSFIQWHRPCVKWCCEIYNQYFKTIFNDGDHCRLVWSEYNQILY